MNTNITHSTNTRQNNNTDIKTHKQQHANNDKHKPYKNKHATKHNQTNNKQKTTYDKHTNTQTNTFENIGIQISNTKSGTTPTNTQTKNAIHTTHRNKNKHQNQ